MLGDILVSYNQGLQLGNMQWLEVWDTAENPTVNRTALPSNYLFQNVDSAPDEGSCYRPYNRGVVEIVGTVYFRPGSQTPLTKSKAGTINEHMRSSVKPEKVEVGGKV